MKINNSNLDNNCKIDNMNQEIAKQSIDELKNFIKNYKEKIIKPSGMINNVSENRNIYNLEIDKTKKGDEVLYIDKNGNYNEAKIIDIHYEDNEPYYTIKINETNQEKQTVATRLIML